tara:strand:- start:3921 stop:4100 length:180 start_codon:yes stop_codon:yes gene_type:complete
MGAIKVKVVGNMNINHIAVYLSVGNGSDVAPNSKHRKMNKAQELGITILEEQAYYDMIK